MIQEFLLDAVARELRALPGYPRLAVLDLSCGRGALLARLAAAGCAVRGTHFRADDYKLAEEGEKMVKAGVEMIDQFPEAARY